MTLEREETPAVGLTPNVPPSTSSAASRRNFIKQVARAGGVLSVVAAATGCSPLIRKTFLKDKVRPVPVGTRSYVSRMFDGIDRSKVWDSHVHIIGNGRSGSGAYVNPAYRDELYKSFLYDFYMSQGGVSNEETADADALARLLRLHRMGNPEGKIVVLAFDVRVDEDGNENLEETEFGVPNAYAARFAAEHVDVKFGASVHPYRSDAVQRLAKAYEAGAILVKWLPNAMGIDPASSKCDAFYAAMVKHDLPLLVHAGEEQAADSEQSQSLGNPLRLRRALDAGVRVIVAHCAGLGEGQDLDAAGDVELANFDLLMRLFDDKQYAGLLFADISAMTQFNRSGRPLREIMMATDLHPRLLNGSDYPLPALDPLVSTRWLERLGYLDKKARQHCNRVYDVNPLLFDFVVKRSLRVRDALGRTHRFSDCVFETARILDKGRA